jgi:peptidoglycan/LPS O-acetylase OafA/YrhL
MQPRNLIDRSPTSVSSDSPTKSFYRPDIDGLRALAVLPVMLFHANLFFPGGFVGVDVFFVISGYLITQIIERDLSAQRFSVLVFYQRRVRRIFPALFVMFAISTLMAYLVLPPLELKDFGKSLLAASAFYSNIRFARLSGYFAPNSEYAPLLHTWTLSVEEQFYVCWPLFLRFLSVPAVSKWKVPASLSVFLASMMLSAHWVNTRPNSAFFLLPSRAWELALGALLSFPSVSRFLIRIPRTLASVASVTGIFMLGLTVITYDHLTPFPGFAALLPCVGAGLIIAAGVGGTSLGGRILSLRPLVWIGLISYSLYLWHWPILVFGRLIANRNLGTLERCGLIALTFIVSWLSWRFVESPFRTAHVVRAGSRNWVIGGLATSAAFLAVGAILIAGNGFPARGPDVSNFLGDVATQEKSLQESPCLVQGAVLPRIDGCLLGAPPTAAQYQVVLWGDSHAAHLAPALSDIGQQLGVTTREITKSGCPPVPGVRFFPVYEMRLECPAFNDATLKTILEDKQVRVVVLAARWDAMVKGLVESYAGIAALLTLDGRRPSVSDSRQLFVASLQKLLTALVDSGHRAILVGEVPLPLAVDCITWARFNRRDESVCEKASLEDLTETEDVVNQALHKASANLGPKVQIVDPFQYLCGDHGCRVQSNGRMLYMDDTHLSYNGVLLLEDSLEESLSSALIATKKPGVPPNQ